MTFDEIQKLAGDLLAHPGFGPGTEMIVEADEVQGVPSAIELRVIANETMPPLLDRGLGSLAIVSSNPFVYGTARVFWVFAESAGGRVAAFRKVEDAGRWISSGSPKITAGES